MEKLTGKAQSEGDTRTADDVVENEGTSRRVFLRHAGMAVGTGLIAAAGACGASEEEADNSQGNAGSSGSHSEDQEAPAAASAHVDPGQLDEYYGVWSGGQSGEVRILGVPSMRELKRIPVFNFDAATGWGATDYSKELLGGRLSGDTHHVHPSYDDGTYDGRYIYVNDKSQGRLARIRCDIMECDRIVSIPHSQGTHGIFPQRHRTGYVFCNAEFRLPLPIDGVDANDTSTYAALHTAVDGEDMEVKWQVMVEGNLDLCATDYEGKYSFATCYNSEGGATLEEMMAADRDCLYVFNIENIERAVREGNTIQLAGSSVPVVDARGENGDYVLRVPVPKSPHGVNVDPTGRYAIASGKLSPTCTVVDIQQLERAFAGEITPRDTVVAEPEVGLGPLHTAYDGRGNAYTSIFIDSVVTKWSIAEAIRAYANEDEEIDPIIQKLDVHYQVGHINASMSETKDADGKWCVALCKFSKDRYLNVGPQHPENDQLIDISGEEMVLAHDGSTYSEPHDCVIVNKDLFNPVQLTPRTGPKFDMFAALAEEDGVDLTQASQVVRKSDDSVRVYMTSTAPSYSMTDFHVKAGDRVQVILSNRDNVEDLSHGFCMTHHDVNFIVNPGDTNSQTFTAGEPGVYWYYCPWFCHALHLEMRGRMFVDPR